MSRSSIWRQALLGAALFLAPGAALPVEKEPAAQVRQQAPEVLRSGARAVQSVASFASGASLPEFQDCDACPLMVVLPGGEFRSGYPKGDGDAYASYPHTVLPPQVAALKSFAMSKYEATFSEWDACVADGGCDDGSNFRPWAEPCLAGGSCDRHPSDEGWGRGSRPVINVSRAHILKQYIPWLNQETGRNYRLPTEAEWEYAARAGAGTTYPWGNDWQERRANCVDRRGVGPGCADDWEHTAPVGSFPANAFGLHDMLGNASEWTASCWLADDRGGCVSAVIRGGSWLSFAEGLWVFRRNKGGPQGSSYDVGFRLVRDIREDQ